MEFAASTTFSSNLLDTNKLVSSPTITILRDSTDAGDAIPLTMHLTRTLLATKAIDASQVVLLTTRTRTSYTTDTATTAISSPPSPHIHPVISRDVTASLSLCKIIDPFLHFPISKSFPSFSSAVSSSSDEDSPLPASFPTSDSTATELAMHNMFNLISQNFEPSNPNLNLSHHHQPRLLVIECLHSLRYSFSIDPAAFIRSITSHPFSISVILAAPMASGIDKDISNLSAIASNIINLSDLRTGVAIDIDGILTVCKKDGKWTQSQSRRYKLTPNEFNISS